MPDDPTIKIHDHLTEIVKLMNEATNEGFKIEWGLTQMPDGTWNLSKFDVWQKVRGN